MANAVLDRLSDGQIDNIISGNGCTTGGVYQFFYCEYDEIDWASVQSSQWDATESKITGLTMSGSATLKRITYDIEQARVDNVLQNMVFYQTDVNLTVFGRSIDIQGTINNIKNKCGNLVCFVVGNDKLIQAIGVKRNFSDDGFEKVHKPLELAEHTGTTGVPGEESRHELVFRCRSEYMPLPVSMTLASLQALL